MRIVFFITVLFFLFGCKTHQVNNKSVDSVDKNWMKLKQSQINQEQKEKAYDLGARVLNTCNNLKFKSFTPAEATPAVIKNTTKEKLQKTCTFFNEKYGSFIDLKLKQVLRDPENKNTIYRYKANYENKNANKELQVTMNDRDKLVALRSKDWTK